MYHTYEGMTDMLTGTMRQRAQMEKSANPAMWAQEKMQQWKEQEAARTARAAQAVQEYKDTQQAQDELNSLEKAMQTMGLSFEDVSTDAASRLIVSLESSTLVDTR
jgi:hypothetical protein